MRKGLEIDRWEHALHERDDTQIQFCSNFQLVLLEMYFDVYIYLYLVSICD